MICWVLYVHVESREDVQCVRYRYNEGSVAALLPIAVALSEHTLHVHDLTLCSLSVALNNLPLVHFIHVHVVSYTGQRSLLEVDSTLIITPSTSGLDNHRICFPFRAIPPMYVSHRVFSASAIGLSTRHDSLHDKHRSTCVLRSADLPRLSRQSDRIDSCSTAKLCPRQSATECV